MSLLELLEGAWVTQRQLHQQKAHPCLGDDLGKLRGASGTICRQPLWEYLLCLIIVYCLYNLDLKNLVTFGASWFLWLPLQEEMFQLKFYKCECMVCVSACVHTIVVSFLSPLSGFQQSNSSLKAGTFTHWTILPTLGTSGLGGKTHTATISLKALCVLLSLLHWLPRIYLLSLS